MNLFRQPLPGISQTLVNRGEGRDYLPVNLRSLGWHEGKHDPWPYINYILSIIKMAYKEFEERLGRLQSPKGEKTALVINAIDKAIGPFRIAELQNACLNVSVDMIRKVLKNLREKNQVECIGRGQNAQWRKTRQWELGNT